jgi:hypothetical protein
MKLFLYDSDGSSHHGEMVTTVGEIGPVRSSCLFGWMGGLMAMCVTVAASALPWKIAEYIRLYNT